MAINEWWASDASQRFWMEITDREDLGADLFAPVTDGSGRPYWGYELVTYVQPGDIVLHWHKTLAGEPGIVGWSHATGAYEETDISWQAHGSVGRTRGTLVPRPAWRMPLLSYTPLASPVLITQVRALEPQLRAAQRDLKARYPDGRLYSPFQFSDKRELRAQQTYFVKMPREMAVLLSLDEVGASARVAAPPAKARATKRVGSGYIADSAVRAAIEWRAVNLATEAYRAAGYRVEYTGASESFDLVATKAGAERHVEVKGSSGAALHVELTIGEVRNSRDWTATDLYVVDGIRWWRESDGAVRADGGDVRWWMDWTAEEGRLDAIRYRYRLPEI
ncbi:hypothetical protein Cch01nite_19850 [Cellulomonas chitinilytica]|uniref:Protein NO VEIN C-terminal domain-containing protein n=1 Tax=Cellulomonas chitinilytica TaxID=398759 RepID=A0A919U1C8_9CELL|nr:DUF3883 domain-containing protein [Cellulomonas chitinilytica]GIG21261.1 hypothetical protein Cch01nite_19850 [Cellulomonas chitinilytica]